MPTYAKSENSRGVVIFANNTSLVDYVKIAEINATLVERYLNLPTTIISTSVSTNNTRFSTDHNQFIPWNNLGRYQAYNLSPYEETILLDADYLIFDDSLLKLFDREFDYLLFDKNVYVNRTGTDPLMGSCSLPFIWATAVLFRKTPKAQVLFSMVEKIQSNYQYYRMLYNIREANFRNDYAFAIADNILSGYCLDATRHAPWPIVTFAGHISDFTVTDRNIVVKDTNMAYVLPHSNLHIMSKEFLMSGTLERIVYA